MTAVHSTLQSVFNVVWQEFIVNDRAQGMEDWGGDCVYRGGSEAHSDLRCIIGVCIPDDMYDPLIETKSIRIVADEHSDFYNRVFNGINVAMLQSLQTIHDEEFDDMEEELRAYADHYDLRIPPE